MLEARNLIFFIKNIIFKNILRSLEKRHKQKILLIIKVERDETVNSTAPLRGLAQPHLI